MQYWSEVTLHVVSGKGGTGKTTIAAALAIALAKGGHRTLLMEVEGRQGIAQLFDTPPLPYEERKIAVAAGGGEVWALAVDTEDALLDYLEMFYKLRRAGSALSKMGAVDFATTIAPGLRDVLLTGKACEVVKRKEKKQDNAYDFVILDAPPTGRIARFLNVNSEVSGLAKVGPIKSHADSVMSVIASEQTTIHLVTLLEEMPVQETLDGVGVSCVFVRRDEEYYDFKTEIKNKQQIKEYLGTKEQSIINQFERWWDKYKVSLKEIDSQVKVSENGMKK